MEVSAVRFLHLHLPSSGLSLLWCELWKREKKKPFIISQGRTVVLSSFGGKLLFYLKVSGLDAERSGADVLPFISCNFVYVSAGPSWVWATASSQHPDGGIPLHAFITYALICPPNTLLILRQSQTDYFKFCFSINAYYWVFKPTQDLLSLMQNVKKVPCVALHWATLYLDGHLSFLSLSSHLSDTGSASYV